MTDRLTITEALVLRERMVPADHTEADVDAFNEAGEVLAAAASEIRFRLLRLDGRCRFCGKKQAHTHFGA